MLGRIGPQLSFPDVSTDWWILNNLGPSKVKKSAFDCAVGRECVTVEALKPMVQAIMLNCNVLGLYLPFWGRTEPAILGS